MIGLEEMEGVSFAFLPYIEGKSGLIWDVLPSHSACPDSCPSVLLGVRVCEINSAFQAKLCPTRWFPMGPGSSTSPRQGRAGPGGRLLACRLVGAT